MIMDFAILQITTEIILDFPIFQITTENESKNFINSFSLP